MPNEAPDAAQWLLDRFGVNEALAGDLLERYRAGRSQRWLWRQMLIAIVHQLADQFRLAPWSASFAVVTGCLLLWGLNRAIDDAAMVGLSRYGSALYQHMDAFVVALIYGELVEHLLVPLLIGWLISGQVRGRGLAAVLALSVAVAIWQLWMSQWLLSAPKVLRRAMWRQITPPVVLFRIVGPPISILIGGLLRHPRSVASPNRADA